jgi:hypothetical protein
MAVFANVRMPSRAGLCPAIPGIGGLPHVRETLCRSFGEADSP